MCTFSASLIVLHNYRQARMVPYVCQNEIRLTELRDQGCWGLAKKTKPKSNWDVSQLRFDFVFFFSWVVLLSKLRFQDGSAFGFGNHPGRCALNQQWVHTQNLPYPATKVSWETVPMRVHVLPPSFNANTFGYKENCQRAG